MYLRCRPNPHFGGRMTRALTFESAPGQRFAIDAETLHKRPELLSAFGPWMYLRFRVLDACAYLIFLLSVLGSLQYNWWLFIPGLAACVLMLAANRKSAGAVARNAARRSADHFRRLHEIGCLWLVMA